jgi:hypothetical protein
VPIVSGSSQTGHRRAAAAGVIVIEKPFFDNALIDAIQASLYIGTKPDFVRLNHAPRPHHEVASSITERFVD